MCFFDPLFLSSFHDRANLLKAKNAPMHSSRTMKGHPKIMFKNNFNFFIYLQKERFHIHPKKSQKSPIFRRPAVVFNNSNLFWPLTRIWFFSLPYLKYTLGWCGNPNLSKPLFWLRKQLFLFDDLTSSQCRKESSILFSKTILIIIPYPNHKRNYHCALQGHW